MAENRILLIRMPLLAHLQGAPIRAPEGSGHPLLAFEDIAERVPAVGTTLCGQLAANGLHQRVRDHTNEAVSFRTLLGLVKDGPPAKFRLQGAEHGLDVGKRGISTPPGFFVPIPDVGTQAVDPGMGVPGAVERQPFPGDRLGFGAGMVGDDLNGIVGGGPAAPLAEAADPLPDRLQPLVGTGRDQPSWSCWSSFSRRVEKCSTIPCSFCARALESQ